MIDVASLSPWIWVVLPVVITAAYCVFGLSGFGSTVIAIPILANFVPISFLVPSIALIDCVSATFVGRTNREHVAKDEMKWILPFMAVGFVVGVTILVKVPDIYLRIALGIFAVLMGIHSIVNPAITRRIPRWWVVPTGIFGGAMSSTFGTGGPIYVTYLVARIPDKDRVRATISTLVAISAIARAIGYVAGGLVTVTVAGAALIAAPFAFLGLRIGTRIHVRLTQVQLRRAVGVIVLLTGTTLLVRAFSA